MLWLFFSCAEPQQDLPKTLLFSPITPEYLGDTAAEWKTIGFDGFLLSDIMRNWSDDIWATDGDPNTHGEVDATFQRVKICNDRCADHGIIDNFIKIAFYSHVPLWTDISAWNEINEKFAEAAQFAKDSGCRGLALDIEYINEQYDLEWAGYTYETYSVSDLRNAAYERGIDLVQSLLAVFPDMVFLTLPEGIEFYGALATDFFTGMLNGMAINTAPGGLFLLTERSYSMTSSLGLIHYALDLEQTLTQVLDDQTRKYWSKYCGIVLGGWPLGYYRKMINETGEFLGYSGREETFGNRVVGSYADKSGRFSPTEFRSQYAGLLLGSKRYCWIYGHGATWWHFSAEDLQRYGKVGNSALPVDDRLDEYKAVVREKWRGEEKLEEMSRLYYRGEIELFIESMGFIKDYYVIGPFGCRNCNNFDRVFPPENHIALGKTVEYNGNSLKWIPATANSKTGYLDLTRCFQTTDWVCAYILVRFESPDRKEAQIRLGTNDTATLWFNGVKILSKNVERRAAPDSDILPIQLKGGMNTILVKVCNTEFDWGLYLRITDRQGDPF